VEDFHLQVDTPCRAHQKKTAGHPAVFERFVAFFEVTRRSLYRRRRLRTRSNQNKTLLKAWL
ncbi:MAG: hypothetical protein V4646_20615, partial [Pseudomonadota bacterium]